jgi:hypothetical protein
VAAGDEISSGGRQHNNAGGYRRAAGVEFRV